jgi:acetoin utilization protein AcuB
MTREVVTVPPDCPLEEAATLMVEHKIGSLPVVEEEQLVGIITETDMFKQFASVLGGGSDSLRLTVQIPDTPGRLAELASRIARVNGNISSWSPTPPKNPNGSTSHYGRRELTGERCWRRCRASRGLMYSTSGARP